jgi:hypothetical protein
VWPVVCVCREKPTYERRQDISLEDFENEPEDTLLPCFWHWSKLSREQKAHAQVLGYDSESWYDDEYRNMTWVMVMKQPHLRLAALALGFTAATWQAHPDLTSDSTLAGGNSHFIPRMEPAKTLAAGAMRLFSHP